jgi:hypothetical protein
VPEWACSRWTSPPVAVARFPVMRFKVAYHVGEQVELETKMASGRLTSSGNSLSLSGPSSLTIPLASITAVELLRFHPRLSLMVRLVAGSNTVCMSVLFFKLFRNVFVCNQDGTIRLYDDVQNRCRALGERIQNNSV